MKRAYCFQVLLTTFIAVSVVNCVSLEVEITSNRKTRSLPTGAKKYQVLPHTDMEFSCIVSGMEQGMVLQLVKVEIKLKKHGGDTQLYKPTTWPYVMAAGDKLDEALLETGRYTVTEEADGSLTMLVSSCLQEDTGLWACRILKHGHEYMISEIDFKVLGPVQGMHLRHSDEPARNESLVSGGELVTSEREAQALSCTIFITNWLPDIVISISDANTDNYRNITGFFTIAGPPETLYYSALGTDRSSLRQYYGGITYKISNLKFSNADNRRRLYCTALGGPLFAPKHVYMDLEVKFKPTNARCERIVSLGPKVNLTCSVRANPEPMIAWQAPDNIDLRVENPAITYVTKEVKDRFFYTWVMEGVNSSFYGEYIMKAINNYGSTSVALYLSETSLHPKSYTGGASSQHIEWGISIWLLAFQTVLIRVL